MNTPDQNQPTPATPPQPTSSHTPQLTNPSTTPPNSQLPTPTPEQHHPLAVSDVLGQLTPLTDLEKAQLMACEGVIATGWATFVQVGLALATIRNGDLYRQDFGTFEEYCRAKWEYGRNYVNRMISAAEVFTTLVTNGHQNPENERQVRPLVGLTADQARTAWNRAVEKSRRKASDSSARQSRRRRARLQTSRATRRPKKAKVKQSRNAMLKTAFADLVSSIKQKADHQLLLEKAQILEWRMGAAVKGVIANS